MKCAATSSIKPLQCFTGASLLLCMSLNAFASDKRTVAATVDILGGREDDYGVSTFFGTLTTPLFLDLNLHIETALEDAFDRLAGAGIHAYWQNLKYGLIGLTASKTVADLRSFDDLSVIVDADATTAGVEAEAYIVSLVLALQTGRISSNLEELDEENYSALDALWYANEEIYLRGATREVADTRLHRAEAGYTFFKANSATTLYGGGSWDAFDNVYLGVEYMPYLNAQPNLALFVEIDHGEEDFDAVYLGASIRYGPVEYAPLIPLFDPIRGGF